MIQVGYTYILKCHSPTMHLMGYHDVDLDFFAYKKKRKILALRLMLFEYVSGFSCEKLGACGEMTKKITKYYDGDSGFFLLPRCNNELSSAFIFKSSRNCSIITDRIVLIFFRKELLLSPPHN